MVGRVVGKKQRREEELRRGFMKSLWSYGRANTYLDNKERYFNVRRAT